MLDLAREIVATKGLSTETAEMRTALDDSNKKLMAQGEAIKDATERVKYGSSMVSVSEAKELLRKDVALFSQRKNTLEFKEKTLAKREEIRETMQKQLDTLIGQKKELLSAIDELEAEWQRIKNL